MFLLAIFFADSVITEGWMRELGVVILNITQLVAALTAAVAGIVALFRVGRIETKVNRVETKTDSQTTVIKSIEEKADAAVSTAVAVDKKTDDQTQKIDTIVETTALNAKQTNGHLSRLQEQNADLNTQFVSALETQRKNFLDAMTRKQVEEASAGGRRKDDHPV